MRKSPSTSRPRRISKQGGRLRFRSAAVVLAAACSTLVGTAIPASATAIKVGQPPLPGGCPGVMNPTNAAPGGGYGLPTQDFLSNGVLTDSGSGGLATTTGITASLCGSFVLPENPQIPDPVPGSPGVNPNVAEAGAVIPPQLSNYTDSAQLTTSGLPMSGKIAIYPAGNTTAVVRQTPRPNGAIDLDIQTSLVAFASNISLTVPLLGLPPITIPDLSCWIGAGPGTGPQTPIGQAQALPQVVNLSTAENPSDTPPAPGAQPPAPVTQNLTNAQAVVVAQPFTLKAAGCTPNQAQIPILGGIVSQGTADIFNGMYLGDGNARFSAPFNLKLSLT